MKIDINFEYSFLLQEGIIGAEIDEEKVNSTIEYLNKKYLENKSLIEENIEIYYDKTNVKLNLECFLFESTNKSSIPEPFLLNISPKNNENIFFDFLVTLNMKILDYLNFSEKIIILKNEDFVKIIAIFYAIKMIKKNPEFNLKLILNDYSYFSFQKYLLDETEKIIKLNKKNINEILENLEK